MRKDSNDENIWYRLDIIELAYNFCDPGFGICHYRIIRFKAGEPFRLMSVLNIQICTIEKIDDAYVQTGGREVLDDLFDGAVRLIEEYLDARN